MYRTVRDIMDANETSWEGIPKLVSKVSELKDRISILEQLSEVQAKITTGVTEARSVFKEEVVDKALKISGALYAFAADSKDPELKRNVSISRTKLSKSGKGITLQLLDRIILEANNHVEDLAEYGITAEDISDLKTRRDILVGMETRTRTVVIDRTNQTRSIHETVMAIDALLRDGIDKLILQNSDVFGEFLTVYSNARNVIKGRSRQKKADNTEFDSENPEN